MQISSLQCQAALTLKITNSNFADGSVNLIVKERQLDSHVQNYFNPLANIVASHEKQKTNNERNNKLIVNLTKIDSDINENLSDNLNLKCRLCKNNHRLMDCSSFKERVSLKEGSLQKKINFVLIVFPKLMLLKIVKSSFICREQNCDKKDIICS